MVPENEPLQWKEYGIDSLEMVFSVALMVCRCHSANRCSFTANPFEMMPGNLETEKPNFRDMGLGRKSLSWAAVYLAIACCRRRNPQQSTENPSKQSGIGCMYACRGDYASNVPQPLRVPGSRRCGTILRGSLRQTGLSSGPRLIGNSAAPWTTVLDMMFKRWS